MMNAEVIIVGGGLSGLYAARLLEKADIDYALLEGRERMGGRILQANAAEADLGATWFWPTIQPALKQLFRELNIESFSHQERGDMLFERPKDAPSRHPGFVSSPAAARVSGGMSRLPNVLLAELKPGRIQTGLQVKHIEQQNGNLNVCGTFPPRVTVALSCRHDLTGGGREKPGKQGDWKYIAGRDPHLKIPGGKQIILVEFRVRYGLRLGTGLLSDRKAVGDAGTAGA